MKTKETKQNLLKRLKAVNDFLASSKSHIARKDKKKAVAAVKYARVSFKDVSKEILRTQNGTEGIMGAESIKDVKENIENAKKALNRKDWINAERFIDYAMAYTKAYNW